MDAKLKKVRAYRNVDGMWFLKLVYEYTDKAGNLRLRIYPKVLLPIAQLRLPEENLGMEKIAPCIECDSETILLQCTCDEAVKRGASDPAYVFDIIIDEAKPKKMTVKEIEDRLGYKVEIVSEEDKDGTCKNM